MITALRYFTILYIALQVGCSTDDHRREFYERENPGCHIDDDGVMVCPSPFTDDCCDYNEAQEEELQDVWRSKKEAVPRPKKRPTAEAP